MWAISKYTAGWEWNTGLNLKLEFIMLSITYLKTEAQHQTLVKLAPIKN